MDPPGCTLILLQRGGPRRELIATSLWEPTGWINRHLPQEKVRAASSLLFIRQPCISFFIEFSIGFSLGEFCTLRPCCCDHLWHLIDVHLIFTPSTREQWGMLASCACLGGLAVLAHRLKQAHYERQ